jgi:hypothetical protein
MQSNQDIPSQSKKVKRIFLTDFQLHTAQKRSSDPLAQILKSFKSPERTHNRIFYDKSHMSPSSEPYTVKFSMPITSLSPLIQKEIAEAEAQGLEIEFVIPKDGIPVYAGKDLQEFMQSKNGKRVLRSMQNK